MIFPNYPHNFCIYLFSSLSNLIGDFLFGEAHESAKFFYGYQLMLLFFKGYFDICDKSSGISVALAGDELDVFGVYTNSL